MRELNSLLIRCGLLFYAAASKQLRHTSSVPPAASVATGQDRLDGRASSAENGDAVPEDRDHHVAGLQLGPSDFSNRPLQFVIAKCPLSASSGSAAEIAPSSAPSGAGNNQNRPIHKLLRHIAPEFVNRGTLVRAFQRCSESACDAIPCSAGPADCRSRRIGRHLLMRAELLICLRSPARSGFTVLLIASPHGKPACSVQSTAQSFPNQTTPASSVRICSTSEQVSCDG